MSEPYRGSGGDPIEQRFRGLDPDAILSGDEFNVDFVPIPSLADLLPGEGSKTAPVRILASRYVLLVSIMILAASIAIEILRVTAS